MSDLKLPKEKRERTHASFPRVAIWIIGGGIALYMILSGVYGAITAGGS
jgi:hypothetical protein